MKYSDIWAKPVHKSATAFMRPAPPEFNEDLDRPTATSPIPEREQHAYLLRHAAATNGGCRCSCTYQPRQAQRGTCSLGGCDRPHVARGSCQKHYDWQKNRRVVIEPRPTAEERFWRKITKNRRRMLDVDRLHDRRIRPVRHRSPIGPGAPVRLRVGHRADPAWHGTRPPERLSAPLRQPRSLGAPATDHQNAIYSAAHLSPTDRRWRTTQRLCVIDGCDHKHVARGVCAKHVDQRS